MLGKLKDGIGQFVSVLGNVHVDKLSFMTGLVAPVVLGGGIYLVCNRLRHKCKTDLCGCATTTYYRLLHLHNLPVTKNGLSVYAVYKFRACDHGHVSVTMKTKMFSNIQICSKPKIEFDWTSDTIENLCARAGISNPGTDYRVEQFNNPSPVPRIPPIVKKKTNRPLV
jgi:hypothetical protein